MRIWVCGFVRTWFYGFLEMWTCTDKGSFGCLFACWCVGMSAYRPPTAPSFHKNTHPSLLVEREGGGVCFVLFFLLPVLQNVFGFYLATSFPNSSCVTHEG